MRAPLTLIVATAPLVLGALAAISSPVGCATSGDLDAGARSDALPQGGSSFACVFDELDTFTCPDLTVAPSPWVGRCVDGDDCTARVNGTMQNAGCQETTDYQNVHKISTSCAAWQDDGGELPSVNSGPLSSVCAPGAPAGFMPTWHPPRAKANECTAVQIEAYLQCLNDAVTTLDPASCAEWSGTLSASDQACLTCLSSNESDSTYGPLVLLPTEILINVAGCIALAEGKTDGSGCGGALQADQECQRAACLPTCPTGSTAEIANEQACESEANALPGDAGSAGVCATFAESAECAGAIEQGDAGTIAEQCFGAPDGGASAEFQAVALAFCGP